MLRSLSHLWQEHRIVLSAFVVAVIAMLYFAGNTMMATMYWMDPAHQDETLAGWMTPRYVAHSYGLPPEVLGEALSLERNDMSRRMSLDTLGKDTGMSMEDMQSRVDAAAAAFRAGKNQ